MTTLYLDRTAVRATLIGSLDEHVHIAEHFLAEIDKLPILMMDGSGKVQIEPRAKIAFVEHVKSLEALAASGDESAIKSLCCMALLAEGWRPDPTDGGGEVIDLAKYRDAA